MNGRSDSQHRREVSPPHDPRPLRLLRVRGSTELPQFGQLEAVAAAGFSHWSQEWPALEYDAVTGELDDLLLHRATRVREAGLVPVFDLRLDQFDDRDPLPTSHPGWFRPSVSPSDPLPDPRRVVPATGRMCVNFADPSVAKEFTSWCCDHLQGLARHGACTLHCEFPHRVPKRTWQMLVDAVRSIAGDISFIALTNGLSIDEVSSLSGAGFDATVSSYGWWDLRSLWYFEEDARLRRVAPVLAGLAVPPIQAATDASANAPALTQARWAAASFLSDGLYVQCADDTIGEVLKLAEAAAWNASAAKPVADIRSLTPLLTGASPLLAVLIERLVEQDARLILANLHSRSVVPARGDILIASAGRYAGFRNLCGNGADISAEQTVSLDPGSVLEYAPLSPRPAPSRQRGRSASTAAREPRLVIEQVTPQVDGGMLPVRRTLGEVLTVEADVYGDGHGHVMACVCWRREGRREWRRTAMRPLGNDRWRADLSLIELGPHCYVIEAWSDEFATLHAELRSKREAQSIEAVDVEDALVWIRSADADADPGNESTAALKGIVRQLEQLTDVDARLDLLLAPETAQVVARCGRQAFTFRHPQEFPVQVERLAARFGSWYELFPRSQSGSEDRHGTFDDVIARLPAIRDMGFDVLYLPPIHPIGERHRKGRNNARTAAPGDPGCPYAIGSDAGGHDAIHSELGDLDDFLRLVSAAHGMGLEIALDLAIQCAPDHPWLREHPGWFSWRADGSLRYAENPPKKYEDIVNVDFYAADAIPGLWNALRDVVMLWVQRGVRMFRVDNPHTKPFPFWQWLIAEVQRQAPDVLFLSEAFTRPKPMNRLAKLGFSQSYTYFTWRNDKQSLQAYLGQLTTGPEREYFRPHFFVNTPDINPRFLQESGRAGHLIRAALATTLSGLWGVYSGFELCEATPRPGSEEYLDSEKYQIRAWNWQRAGNIVAEITRLNMIRRATPELQTHLGLRFYACDNDLILYFGKRLNGSDTMILVAVGLDPSSVMTGTIEVPLWEFNQPDHGVLEVEDLWLGQRHFWRGRNQQLTLSPERPFALWRIARRVST